MRVLVLTGLITASPILIGCHAGPPPASVKTGQAQAMPPAIAELPPAGRDMNGNFNVNGHGANGPPLDLLQPPR